MVVLSHCEGKFVDDDQTEGDRCAACEERVSIRRQIQRLEQKIMELKAKHEALGTMVNETHDPFIHKFPPEISSHIFGLCVPTLNRESLERRECERWAWTLTLGAVCRNWRQLAWATPVLWDTLYLEIRLSMAPSLVNSLPSLFFEWLSRSRMLPLTIVLRNVRLSYHPDSMERGEIMKDATHSILKVINLHSSRLRNFRAGWSVDTFEDLCRSMESNQLLHLDIRTDPYWDIPQAIPVTTMLSLFERSGCCLQVLSLVGIAPPADDLSNLLQAMPSLERLSLFFKMRWMDAAFMDDIFNRIFRTIPGGDVVSLEGATPKPFLPNLQILDCRAQNHQLVTPFSWDRIPQHYRQGHRRSLTLKSSASTIHIKIGTALELVQLVDEGVDLQIVDKETGLDFLEKLRNLTSKQLADMEFRTARRT